MDHALVEAAFERGRRAGVRIGRWRDGTVPLFVNTTRLRRPVAADVGLFLGWRAPVSGTDRRARG